MRDITSANSIMLGTRRYCDASGRFSQIDDVNYQNRVVVYSVVCEDSGVIMSGYRTTIEDIIASWKMLDQNEKHPWQIKKEAAGNQDS